MSEYNYLSLTDDKSKDAVRKICAILDGCKVGETKRILDCVSRNIEEQTFWSVQKTPNEEFISQVSDSLDSIVDLVAKKLAENITNVQRS